jgi:poly-gamma-glutamate capsule biosynthesis protein CapA/YwtB (metallophosphatase superfamily)
MSVVLAAVGDVLVDREAPAEALAGVAPLLEAADLAFGNFEGVLTDTELPRPGAESTVVATANAAPLGVFDVMSLANNHTVDAGPAGFTTRSSR